MFTSNMSNVSKKNIYIKVKDYQIQALHTIQTKIFSLSVNFMISTVQSTILISWKQGYIILCFLEKVIKKLDETFDRRMNVSDFFSS